MTTGPATLSAATRRSILLLSFATFASMAAQRICDAMLPELSRAFAVSLAQAAQVVSVFAVVYGLSQLVYGPLGDRLGKFGIVTFATLACCVGSIVSVFAASLDMLVLARVMVALGLRPSFRCRWPGLVTRSPMSCARRRWRASGWAPRWAWWAGS